MAQFCKRKLRFSSFFRHFQLDKKTTIDFTIILVRDRTTDVLNIP